jgi:hypothetical protein
MCCWLILSCLKPSELDTLKMQFHATYQSLHPLNLIKHFFDGTGTSKPETTGSFSQKIIGIASSYISNKMVVGASKNLVKKGIGSVLQLVLAQSIANNRGAINKGIAWLLQRFVAKKNVA